MLSVIYMSSRLDAMKAIILLLHEMSFKNVRSHPEKKIPILSFQHFYFLRMWYMDLKLALFPSKSLVCCIIRENKPVPGMSCHFQVFMPSMEMN
jgi:hypothetical protein